MKKTILFLFIFFISFFSCKVEQIDYYENGNVFSHGYIKKGKKEGVWKYYHENGRLSKQISYKMGQFHGSWLSYFQENEKIRDKSTYIRG